MIKRLVRILGKTFLTFFIFSITVHSQTNGSHIPAGYFRNPLNIPLEIVANMGELRPNHWHMGLDIRTNQKENLPVHAAAAGYIAHIGIRPQSFGRFIVINHTNGLSTLYAHLNDFFPALEEYVTAQQYKQESWAIELDLSKDKFPVSKGQLIAYSGNTGGSQGPHVHFEIFDTKSTKRLNPLLFGFPLKDNVAPNLVKLALYDRQKSVYEQSPILYSLKNTDSGYIIPKVAVIRTGMRKLSFALQAYDRITGSANADGIFSAEIFVDDRPYIRFVIDSISYTGTSYMNAHIDYKYRYNGGAFLQHLSRMPGDVGGVYHPVYNDGIIELNDTLVHAIRVDIWDAYKNLSQLNFNLQYVESMSKFGASSATQQLLPNEVSVLEKEDVEIYIPETCLYDTVRASYYRNPDMSSFAVSAAHQLNDQSIPVHDEMTVRIKALKPILPEWKDRLVIQRRGRTTENKKAEQQGDWFAGKFGDFGTFQVFADVVPPAINSIGNGDTVNLSAARRILFTPTDNFGIRKFRVELNGEWLRFTNDKGRNWIYQFDERCPYGTHHLKVIAEDIVGNTTVKEWWFKRGPYTPPKKKAVKKKSSKKKTTTKKK